MPTDDERRAVARRLRSFVTDDSVYADVDACRVLHSIGLYYKDIDRIYFSGFDVARLADLIEPPLQCPHYHSDRHYCSVHEDVQPIDRDALLELADEMYAYSFNFSSGLQECTVQAWAQAIREACGEEGRRW